MRVQLRTWGVSALLSVLCFDVALCFPNGSVAMSCGNMLPVHEPFSPNGSRPPYTLSASADTYRPGQRITELFPVGTFTELNSSLVTALSCNNRARSAVSQANNAKRKRAELVWAAPNSRFHGDVFFRATVIKSYSTFWLNVTSDSLRLERASRAPTATSGAVLFLCPLALALLS